MSMIDQPYRRAAAAQLRFSLIPASTQPQVTGPSWLRRLWLWAAAAWDRNAPMTELTNKTDHELADIGLVRGDLPSALGANSTRDRRIYRLL